MRGPKKRGWLAGVGAVGAAGCVRCWGSALRNGGSGRGGVRLVVWVAQRGRLWQLHAYAEGARGG